MLRSYLESHFRIHLSFQDNDLPEDSDLLSDRIRWVGKEERQAYVGWYFEIDPVSKECPEMIDVTLLFNPDESELHRVVFLGVRPKQAHSLPANSHRIKLPEFQSTAAP